jgi:hypothetical protein
MSQYQVHTRFADALIRCKSHRTAAFFPGVEHVNSGQSGSGSVSLLLWTRQASRTMRKPGLGCKERCAGNVGQETSAQDTGAWWCDSHAFSAAWTTEEPRFPDPVLCLRGWSRCWPSAGAVYGHGCLAGGTDVDVLLLLRCWTAAISWTT